MVRPPENDVVFTVLFEIKEDIEKVKNILKTISYWY
jgi:hypothetical protein